MVATMEDQRKLLALSLYEISGELIYSSCGSSETLNHVFIHFYISSAFKFGEFTLKSGEKSPVYFDLRVIISHPDVIDQLNDLLHTFIQENAIECDQLCGVPYTGKYYTERIHCNTFLIAWFTFSALPIATLLSHKTRKPMLIRRKEAKTGYGTAKLIEGIFKQGEKCLIIEDVVTTGSSVLETSNDLKSVGLIVEDAIVVVNREQGGSENLVKRGIKMYSLFTLKFLLETLRDAGRIEDSTVRNVGDYIARSQTKIGDGSTKPPRLSMSFRERAKVAKNEVSRALLSIIDQKNTNLCLAADLTKADEILNLVQSVGPYICLLKTHVDLIEDFNADFTKKLKSLAQKHNFLIMEDRKFADIGNTVDIQYTKGIYQISNWADLVTVHSLPGEGILKALKEAASKYSPRGAFLLAEMSSEGNLISSDYKEKTMKMATNHSDFVAGIVGQSADLVKDPGLIQLTPGVKLEAGGDNLGQQYNTPEYVMKEKGADIAVVGRGIINSKNPGEMAKIYRDRLWEAYLARIQ